MSQPSLSGMGDRDDRDEPTPPISPFIGSEGTSGAKTKPTLCTQKSAPNFSRKFHQDSSLEADDTESELVAIPESDLSESTLHNSVHGSFDEAGHFDEMAQPLKPEQAKGKVTTANLATAQVAITTLGVAEREEKTEKKTSRLFMKLNSLDKIGQKYSSDKSRCSVQEGVRMMVFMSQQKPIDTPLQQSTNVHRSSLGAQESKAKEPEAKTEPKEVSETDGAVKSVIGSMLTEASTSVAKQLAIGPTKPTSECLNFFEDFFLLFSKYQFCFSKKYFFFLFFQIRTG